MGQTLAEIAQVLHDSDTKVQLIYAFNSTGKTRLLQEFRNRFVPKADDEDAEFSRPKLLHYSAFTEDLFYWDNDMSGEGGPKMKIQPNAFTNWVLREQGQDRHIITRFQHYAGNPIAPRFNPGFTEVTFSFQRGNDSQSSDLKISRGEESLFIWSLFHTLLDLVIDNRTIAEPGDRDTDAFDELECVFIDDPVSSLDENHVIELAVELAALIKSSPSGLNFIITTHSPLFYNVLHNELNSKTCHFLERFEGGTFALVEKRGDSNTSFSYHLHLKQTLEQAIANDQIERYHFTLLRNLYEKTAGFLGYPGWSALLPGDKQAYLNRITQFTSHSTLSHEAVARPRPQEKQTVRLLLENLIRNYNYWQQDAPHG